MNDNTNFLELLISIFLASFGGVVNRLAAQEKNPRKKIKAGAYISSSIISLFVGIVVYSICKHYNMTQNLVMAFTAVSGFIGTPVIYMVFNFATKSLHLKDDKGDGEQ